MNERRFSGERLRLVREFRDLSQRDLATLAGVSCPFISQLETGRCVPSVDRAFRLASALKIHIFHLVPFPRVPTKRGRRP